MAFSRVKILVGVLIIISIFAIGDFYVLFYQNIFSRKVIVVSAISSKPTSSFPQKLNNPPEIIKAVYVTGYSAGTKSYRNYLTELFKNTEINAVVVDIKGSDGYVTYNSQDGEVIKYNLSDHAISDIDSLIRFFHDQNIYVIGRIAVFEDPVYSKKRPNLAIYNKNETLPVSPEASRRVLWKDDNGLSWLDPSSKDVWDYDISLAKDGFLHGFDEINFDYSRFPTDGNAGDMGFPVYDGKTSKADVIKSYFEYVRSQLIGQKISIDLFGQTTTNKDDMGIGQLLENAFENFNYICPMVYPSHYINGFIGFANPADHPYEVVKYAMSGASTREKIFLGQQNLINKTFLVIAPLAKFRPWLQNFNMGAFYTADMVKQEIKATQDSLGSDYNGFMLWNPSNKYTQEAVLKTN
jgi:hypothetical protein